MFSHSGGAGWEVTSLPQDRDGGLQSSRRQSTLSVVRSRLHWACDDHRCWLHCIFMQRYSENCVRAPQASRGLAGARAACCCALRVGGGIRVAGGCAIAAGSADAAVAAAGRVVRSGLARDAGAGAPVAESTAVRSVGIGFVLPASAAIGALAGDAGAEALAGESAALGSVGIGFALAASAAIGGGAGAEGPTAEADTAALSSTPVSAAGADTVALSPTPVPPLMPRASRTRPNPPSWPNSNTPMTSSASSTNTAPVHVATRRGVCTWRAKAVRSDGSPSMRARPEVASRSGSGTTDIATSKSWVTRSAGGGCGAGAGVGGMASSSAAWGAGAGDDARASLSAGCEGGADEAGTGSFSAGTAVDAARTWPAAAGAAPNRARICATLCGRSAG